MPKPNWPIFALLVVVLAILVALASCTGVRADIDRAALVAIEKKQEIDLRAETRQQYEIAQTVDQITNAGTAKVENKIDNTVNDLWATIFVVLAAQLGLVTVIIVWANKRQLKEIKNGGKT